MARTPEPAPAPQGAADLGRILGSARGYWSGVAPEARRRYALLVAGLLVAALVASYFLTRNPMTLAFYNLSPSDAGQVTQQLTSLKIPYQLKGTSVYVPSSMADQARVDLATQGLPAEGSVGYSSVLKSAGIGMTDQQFTLATQNALQADLGTTIQSISGVQSATVYVVPQQQSIFVDQSTSQASATVFVSLVPGVTLSPQQVLGVEELVAHSVQGLTAAHVMVVDQRGDPLSAASGSSQGTLGGGAGAAGEMGTQQNFEQNLDQQLTALLEPIVGRGNVIVQTHATLDMTQTQSQSTIVQPLSGGQGVPVSNHTIQETYSGTGSPPAVSGSGSSVPTYPSSAGGQNSMKYTETTINYDVTKINKTVTSQPFTLQGLTVSVMLNSGGYKLTPQNQQALQKVIATAVGYTSATSAQNDITIFAAPFQKPKVPPLSAVQTSPLKNPMILGAAGGALLLLLGMVVLVRRRGGGRRAAPPVRRQPLEPPPPPPPPDPNRQVLDRVRNLVEQSPEEAAQLVRGWLREDVKPGVRRRP